LKVMYITAYDPFHYGGGTIGTKKILEPLMELKKQGLIELRIVALDKGGTPDPTMIREGILRYIKKGKYDSIVSRMMLHSTAMDRYISCILREFVEFEPDCVLLQSSRLGNIAKKIKKMAKNRGKQITIIQNFDNFELELVKASELSWPIKCVESVFAFMAEKAALKNADYAIFLRHDEAQKVFTYYKSAVRYKVLPFYYGEVDDELFLWREQKLFFYCDFYW